jgi:hypothetical protein
MLPMMCSQPAWMNSEVKTEIQWKRAGTKPKA